jgi:hypothetical protein
MGIVAVGARQPRSICGLLTSCLSIDDEYIVERVLLASYGALLRSPDSDCVANAAAQTWRHVFEPGPPTNALIRDHGRLLIELAAEREVLPAEVDLEACRPPYGAPWPPDWPSDEVAATAGAEDENEDAVGPAVRRLRNSVRFDDFSIYTMTSALRTHARFGLDMAAAKAWILREVERMGFRGELFDMYDGAMLYEHGGGRGRPSWAERIGKKYQWIALYRLIGFEADNIPLAPRTESEAEFTPAVGPLQAPGERNLDPSMLIRSRPASRATSWWAPVEFDLRSELTDAEWLDDPSFVDSLAFIEITKPSSGQACLGLELLAHWDERDPDDTRYPYRSAFMQIRSYLVPAASAEETWAWLQVQDFHGRWMPEGFSWLSYVFAGEYPWGVQARIVLDVIEAEDYRPEGVPDLVPTAGWLSLEFEFDAYHEETIGFHVPTRPFFEENRLRWDGLAGYFGGEERVLEAPNVAAPGQPSLVADRAWLEEVLRQREFSIFWTVLSEKQIVTDGRHDLGYAVHWRAHRLRDGTVESAASMTRRIRPGDETRSGPRPAPLN